MSLRHTRRVWALDLKPHLKYMLFALADCANEDNECWPGMDYLAKRTGYDLSSVKRLLLKLITSGLVVVVAVSKRGQPTHYRLMLWQDNDAIGVQNGPLSNAIEVQNEPSSERNEGSFCSNGGSFCSTDMIMTRARDPKDPEEEKDPPISPPKGGRYPYEFEYYFWDVYPNPVGKGAASRAFQTLHLTLPQLVAMREAILAHRRYNPRWRPDAQGRVFIPKPATWLRERRFDDPVPGPKGARPPQRCEHPPEQVTQDARGAWFCSCGHILSPEEAEHLGLTAKADDNAREALQQIRSILGEP